MTEAGKKMIASARSALAFVRGETATPMSIDDLNNALPFLYAIVGAKTAEEAADIWRLNPEARMQAHRAIYESKPRDEPYDEMMARLRPETKGAA